MLTTLVFRAVAGSPRSSVWWLNFLPRHEISPASSGARSSAEKCLQASKGVSCFLPPWGWGSCCLELPLGTAPPSHSLATGAAYSSFRSFRLVHPSRFDPFFTMTPPAQLPVMSNCTFYIGTTCPAYVVSWKAEIVSDLFLRSLEEKHIN